LDLILLILALLNLLSILFLVLQMEIQRRSRRTTGDLAECIVDMQGEIGSLSKQHDAAWQTLRNDLSLLRSEFDNQARHNREEISQNLNLFGDSVLKRMNEIANLQKNQLDFFASQINQLSTRNDMKLESLRQSVETHLTRIQIDNQEKLDQIRITVDEKLHNTLEKRLGASFQLVSDRLEMVHKGLGEMQSLASGVGDLKKVLTNIKTRGIWGEIQLGNILAQVLNPEQYVCNINTRPDRNERVEFAICLPGSKPDESVWLPIDAKFPQEDYLRLVEATEQGNSVLADEAARQLEKRIKMEARMIQDKYVDPPHTTDFAVMFLPTESLYAEVAKRPGLLASLQNDYRIVITGPSTMLALLNSLSIGFRTLAIEQRSVEVWDLLAAVKNDFCIFGDVLDKTRKKLDEASNSIETASRRSRSIERRLRKVEELPAGNNPSDQ